jgi:hypothetical protein
MSSRASGEFKHTAASTKDNGEQHDHPKHPPAASAYKVAAAPERA